MLTLTDTEHFFLVHLNLWLMVSYCDRWIPGVSSRRPVSWSTIASKDISSLTTGWIWTKLGRNDPYMALFNNCSNGSGPLHIYGRPHRLKKDFQGENFKNLLV